MVQQAKRLLNCFSKMLKDVIQSYPTDATYTVLKGNQWRSVRAKPALMSRPVIDTAVGRYVLIESCVNNQQIFVLSWLIQCTILCQPERLSSDMVSEVL